MGATLKMKECDTMRILVVEDDRLLNNTLCYNLYTAGYVVDSVLTKSAASNFLTKQDYDLIVLDINLPDGNGFDFCREVKERRPDTAVIFLTANDMESDMLKGYELGAEDYVTKPFSMKILLKKIDVLCRNGSKQEHRCFEDGFLRVDFDAAKAWVGGKECILTPTELRMLRYFTENAGVLLTYSVLLEKLWDSTGAYVDKHTLAVNVNRLRKKIEDEEHRYILNVYGMGYQWAEA